VAHLPIEASGWCQSRAEGGAIAHQIPATRKLNDFNVPILVHFS
jgi:hypothetical protein